jgi:CheY-like chemotaxis protein
MTIGRYMQPVVAMDSGSTSPLTKMTYLETFTAGLHSSPRTILNASGGLRGDLTSPPVNGDSEPVKLESYRKQILCVENERDACSAIAAVLASYKLAWAESMDDARELFRLQRFSLIFISDNLPDGDGLKLCEEIRDVDYLTPIIMMTRNPELSEIHTRIAGAQRLIKKHQPDYLKELRVLADYLSV